MSFHEGAPRQKIKLLTDPPGFDWPCFFEKMLQILGMVGRMNAINGPLVALIVPVWMDDAFVADLINRLEIDSAAVEWIVAAVHPSQSLRDLERAGRIRLVLCEKPSRGAQMNAGAKTTRASLLCFHHADSELRPEHVASLVAAAQTEGIIGGAFHRRFDDRRFWMTWWESLLRRASKVAGPLFGDQSLFVKTDIFQQLGGFAEIPLMEDIELSRRLRRIGRITLLDPPLWSSPRRFRRLGNARTLFVNTALIALFYLGVNPQRLHRWYYARRYDDRASANQQPANSPW
jgi:rSAM/selenodomain-associated transferase 2